MPSEELVVAQKLRNEYKCERYALNALAPELALRAFRLRLWGLDRSPAVQAGLKAREEQGMAIAILALPPRYHLYLKPFIPFPRPRDLLEVAEEVKRSRRSSQPSPQTRSRSS